MLGLGGSKTGPKEVEGGGVNAELKIVLYINMALFKVSLQEEPKVQNWLNEIQSELGTNLKILNDKYNYDFIEDKPYNKTKNYEWLGERELSTRASRFTLNSYCQDLDEIPDIPDIPEI